MMNKSEIGLEEKRFGPISSINYTFVKSNLRKRSPFMATFSILNMLCCLSVNWSEGDNLMSSCKE